MTEGRVKAVVFSSYFAPAYLGGGPIRTLSALVRNAAYQYEVMVVTSDRDLGQRERLDVVPNRWVPFGGASVWYVSADNVRCLLRGYRSATRLEPEFFYLNSFFDFKFSIAPQIFGLVFGRGVPRLLAPRGEFSSGALKLKRVKKRAFIFMYRSLGLDRGVTWHASTEKEAQDIRRIWGADSAILVRENETSLALEPRPPVISPDRNLRLVFVGRIVPKKGLHVALEALRDVRSRVELDIFGAEEDLAYVLRCKTMAREMPDGVTVRFHGAVRAEAVTELLSKYDAMLMPTAGENFGHVIAEALSVSLPVFCTPHTPWTARLQEGGGEVLDSGKVSQWRETIEAYASMSSEERLVKRLGAMAAYAEWRRSPAQPHVFTLMEQRARDARGK